MIRTHLGTVSALVAAAALAALVTSAEAGLGCGAGNGDVAAHPIINNTGPQTIAQGTMVYYAVVWPNKPKVTKRFSLPNPLPPGGMASPSNYFTVPYSCTAWTSLGVLKKPSPGLIQINPKCILGVTC